MTADIYQYLVDQELQQGAKNVRDACRRYMLRKTYAGVEGKRKPVPRAWTKEAYVKQSGKCAICHQPMDFRDAAGDHMRPIAKGGEHKRWNIQAVHKSCNSSKGADDLLEQSRKTGKGFTELVRTPIEEDC